MTATPEQAAQWSAAQLARQEQMRTVLTDDRFYKFVASIDSSYAMVARFVEKNSGATPATSYQVYRLRIEAESTLAGLNRAPGGNAAAELASKLAAYNTRLDALLGPEGATAYRKQRMARIFNPPASPPPKPGGG